jgi:hypothetical protein
MSFGSCHASPRLNTAATPSLEPIMIEVISVAALPLLALSMWVSWQQYQELQIVRDLYQKDHADLIVALERTTIVINDTARAMEDMAAASKEMTKELAARIEKE